MRAFPLPKDVLKSKINSEIWNTGGKLTAELKLSPSGVYPRRLASNLPLKPNLSWVLKRQVHLPWVFICPPVVLHLQTSIIVSAIKSQNEITFPVLIITFCLGNPIHNYSSILFLLIEQLR